MTITVPSVSKLYSPSSPSWTPFGSYSQTLLGFTSIISGGFIYTSSFEVLEIEWQDFFYIINRRNTRKLMLIIFIVFENSSGERAKRFWIRTQESFLLVMYKFCKPVTGIINRKKHPSKSVYLLLKPVESSGVRRRLSKYTANTYEHWPEIDCSGGFLCKWR